MRPWLLAAAFLAFGVTACGSSSPVASHSSSPEAAGSRSAAADLDSCLVASWKLTSYKFTGAVQPITGGTGATLKATLSTDEPKGSPAIVSPDAARFMSMSANVASHTLEWVKSRGELLVIRRLASDGRGRENDERWFGLPDDLGRLADQNALSAKESSLVPADQNAEMA